MRRLWVVSSIQSQHIFPCDTAKLIGYDIPEEIQNKILQKICWIILLYFLENLSIQNNLYVYITLSKVSKLGFFFWSTFSRIRTEQETLYLSVFSANTGKYRSEKALYLDTFHAVHEQTTPNIRFSIEDQKIGSLPILDIKTGKIWNKCVRKRKIQCCVYTSFTRFIPLEHKFGFCTAFFIGDFAQVSISDFFKTSNGTWKT